MFGVGGIGGPLGRASLIVGLVAAVFGMFAAISGTRSNDARVLRLVPRFAYLACAGAIGAFVAMEIALINRDFTLEYVQKVGSKSTPALYNFTESGALLKAPFCCGC